jgi:amino acid transporter
MSNEPSADKSLTRLGAWMLAFGCIIGWGSFVMPGTTFLSGAGPLGTVLALAFAGAGMALIAVNYRYMIQRFPVAGGAFIYARETFGRKHGFACGWFLVLAFLSLVAQNGTALALISRYLMNHVAEFGFSYYLAGYQVYLGELILMLCVLWLLALIIMRSNRLTYLVQSVFALCLVLFLIAVIVAAFASPVSSAANLKPAFNPGKPPLFGVLVVLSFAPWAFLGFDVVSQTAGELSFPVRQVGRVMITAIACGFVVYVVATLIAASVVPGQYADWAEYVSATGQLTGLDSIPVFNAIHAMFGQAGVVVLCFATLAAVLSGIVGFAIATSRLLFAMARDGLLPAWLGERSERYGTPVHAVLLTFVLASAVLPLGRSILSWIVDMSSVGAALSFLYTSAAARRLAHQEGHRLVSVTGSIGIVLSVLFIILLLVPVPAIGTSLAIESFVFLVAWIVFGLNIYSPQPLQRGQLDLGDRLTAIDSESGGG